MNDPIAPDAPLVQLLSLKHNPLLKDMSDEDLSALVTRLKTVVQQPVTLKAELAREAKPRSPLKAAQREFLDNL